jgi:hypothetical protein
MKQRIRITIEATILDKKILEQMRGISEEMASELQEEGKVENVKYKMEEL